jgi:hypothetical protein
MRSGSGQWHDQFRVRSGIVRVRSGLIRIRSVRSGSGRGQAGVRPGRGQAGVRPGSGRGQAGVRPGSGRGQAGVRPGSSLGWVKQVRIIRTFLGSEKKQFRTRSKRICKQFQDQEGFFTMTMSFQ